jgi:hypothetical protein
VATVSLVELQRLKELSDQLARELARLIDTQRAEDQAAQRGAPTARQTRIR